MQKQDYKFGVGNQYGPFRAGATPRQSRGLRANRAFTFAELLIVVVIIAVVTIATIPLLKPAMDSRRIREAARIVSSQFAAAQGEAVATGHTVGVWLEKLHLGGTVVGPTSTTATEGNSCMDLYLCESPQPYSGDSTNATCQVSLLPETSDAQGNIVAPINIYFASGFTPAGLVEVGDQIIFNYRGASYTITGPDTDGDGFVDAVNSTTPVTAQTILQDHGTSGWPQSPAQSAPVSYQILRLPVKSVNTPVQLPNGSVIDLSFGGLGNPSSSSNDAGWFGTLIPSPPASTFSQDTHSLAVLFDSTGRPTTLYVNGAPHDITAPLYFMIGKREQVPTVELDTSKQNWADQDNLWISINPQTGLVSTAEVAAPDASIVTVGPPQIVKSRAFATAAQAMGGK